ncbi:hypothetical protein EMCRGX_G025485 [Ephydatia muelleri]
MAQSDHFKAKVVLLGEGAVGKTSIVTRYVKNTFNNQHVMTLQAAFLQKTLNLGGRQITLNLWDTAGQEQYHALGPIYYRGSHAAVVVYDITDANSFTKAQNWVKELRKIVGDGIVVAVVGNKADIIKNRAVEEFQAEEYAASVGAKHYYASAKMNTGIQELFLDISKRLLLANPQQPPEPLESKRASRAIVVEDEQQQQQQDGGGCSC